MTNSTNVKPPVWFWVVAILALLWNAMGVFAYLVEAYMTPEMLEALPENKRNLYEMRPAWVTASFATAVFAGLLGSLGLVMRRNWSGMLLLLSLVAVILQDIYFFLLSDTIEVMGTTALVMPLIVLLIAFLLVGFSRKGKSEGWLR